MRRHTIILKQYLSVLNFVRFPALTHHTRTYLGTPHHSKTHHTSPHTIPHITSHITSHYTPRDTKTCHLSKPTPRHMIRHTISLTRDLTPHTRRLPNTHACTCTLNFDFLLLSLNKLFQEYFSYITVYPGCHKQYESELLQVASNFFFLLK